MLKFKMCVRMEKRGNLTVFNTVVSARQAHLGILGIANLLGSSVGFTDSGLQQFFN